MFWHTIAFALYLPNFVVFAPDPPGFAAAPLIQTRAAAAVVPALVTQEAGPVLPPGDPDPVLQLEPRGPLGLVTSVAFSPDGDTLYTGGLDKVVRVWRFDRRADEWVYDPTSTLRVPLGPGTSGAINCMAVSTDGKWLAAAGKGVMRGGAGFRTQGVRVSYASISPEMRLDQGMIYLFDLNNRTTTLLRGHHGTVASMRFASQANRPLLVSLGIDWNQASKSEYWTARYFDLGPNPRHRGGFHLGPATNRGFLPTVAVSSDATGSPKALIGFGSGRWNLWDVNGGTFGAGQDRPYNLAAVQVGRGRILAGSQGRLTLWDVNGAQPQIVQQTNLDIVPFAIDQAGPNRAVVVGMNGQRASMLVVDLNGLAVLSRAELWTSSKFPSVAGTPDGRYLAVAGNAGNGVRVYRTDRLGQSDFQLLQGVGTIINQVSFVRNGDQRGLLVRDQGGTRSILDLANSQLVADNPNWQLDRPNGGALQLRQSSVGSPSGAARVRLSVVGGNANGQVLLQEGENLTATTLVPAGGELRTPLLVVATLIGGEPELKVYDASTGALLRQLTGHLGAVRQMDVSGDGQLLATVADDRTARVWSLRDIAQLIGMGRLKGVGVLAPEGVPEISRVDPPLQGQLQVGDEIAAIVRGNELLPVDQQFIEANSQVTIRILRNGVERDVVVPTSQRVDERKPLFSLFLTAADQQWIGWNPYGPYETSGRNAERYIGWHFNTGDPLRPTSFALAEQYRDKYYRTGILDHLIREHELPTAPVKLPVPSLTLWIQQADQDIQLVNESESVTVNRQDVNAGLAIGNGFPADGVRSLAWTSEDGKTGAFRQVNEQEWVADLTNLNWNQPLIRVNVRLQTDEADPQQYQQQFTLRYTPPAPAIETDLPARIVVRDSNFVLKALVRPTQVAAAVGLVQRVGEEVVFDKQFEYTEESVLEQAIALRPGENRLELVARNKLDGDKAVARARHLVVYAVEKAPPEITVESIFPGDSGGLPVPVPRVGTATLTEPQARVAVKVQGQEPLTSLQIKVGDQTRVPEGFEPGSAAVFSWVEKLQLNPGVQQVQIEATTNNSEPARQTIDFSYLPELPEVIIDSPRNGLDIEREPARVTLKGHLDWPKDRQPFRAQLLIDSQLREGELTVDDQGLFETEVDLHPGTNWIQVRLDNEWGATSVTQPLSVGYWRPPEIIAIQTPAAVRNPLLELSFLVRTSRDLPITSVQVAGKTLGKDQYTETKVSDENDKTVWKFTVADVGLEEGVNQIPIRVRNKEAWCLNIAVHRTTVMVPPPPKAVIQLEDAAKRTVSERSYLLRFSVQSRSQLQSIVVRQRDEVVHQEDLSRTAANDAGLFAVRKEVELELRRGVNAVTVSATNQGGERTAEMMLSYVAVPVRVEVLKLVSATDPSQSWTPRVEDNKLFIDNQIPESRLTLFGRVIWSDSKDQRIAATEEVKVWVNGFNQRPAALEAPAANDEGDQQRLFQTRIVLNRKQDNIIELGLPGLEREYDSRMSLSLDCADPELRRRLHLLVVGIGDQDKGALVQRALDVLDAEADPKIHQQFSSPAFPVGRIYGPLTGDLVAGQILSELISIRNWISRRQRNSPNDIVMVYFQGDESRSNDGHFLLLDKDPERRRDVLNSRSMSAIDLQRFLDSTEGAKIVWLDVFRTKDAKQDYWPDTFRAAVFCYAWFGQDPTPDDARLISAMENVVPRSRQVGEVRTLLGDFGLKLTEKYPKEHIYEANVHNSLLNVELNKVQ